MNRGYLLVLAAALLLCLAATGPAQAAKPPTPIILPPVSYTPDDGLGLGLYVGAQRKVQAPQLETGGDRPWLWDLGVIGMIYLKPKPVAWGFAVTYSRFPDLPRPVEIVLSAASHGWNQEQWFGLGNGSL